MWGLLGKAFQLAVLGTGGAVVYSQRDKIGASAKEEFEEAKRDPGQYLSDKADVVVDAASNIGETADSIGNGIVNTYDTVSTTATEAKNLADQLTGEGESGVGGLFNSVMSGDIFNMDNAKTAGKWGLGGFLLYKVFDWLKDSFTGNNNDNDNNNGGGISTALKLAVVIGASAFIYNKFGDDIKNGLGIGDDKPEADQDKAQPVPQNLDYALQGYDM